MKRLILFYVLVLSAAIMYAQSSDNTRLPVIGEKAPSFTVQTTNGNLTFPSDFGRSWKILLSHPQDFTPVCSSELLELAYMQDDFNKSNTKILVLSVDSLYSHKDWIKAMEEIDYKGRGPAKIKFPIAVDRNNRVSKRQDFEKRDLIKPVQNQR